jgi:hypothetical protein
VYRLCAYVLLKDFFNLKLTKLLISSFVLVIRKIGICMYIIRKIFDSNFNISSDIREKNLSTPVDENCLCPNQLLKK